MVPVRKPRNAALDVLRGVAILLMVVDHVAYFNFNVPIELTSLRIVTRCSMPLFCSLMGYFLVSKDRVNWIRFYQLLFAAAAVNVAFFTLYNKLEILASLLVCYVLYLGFRSWLCFAFVAVYFSQLDPSVLWFDYPLPIVLSCVAQGMILRKYGGRVALVTGCLITVGMLFVPPPATYVLIYVVPASLLIAWAAKYPEMNPARWHLQPLQFAGRYPLTVYLAQYFIILSIGRLV